MRRWRCSIQACALVALVASWSAIAAGAQPAQVVTDDRWLPEPYWAAPMRPVLPAPATTSNAQPEPIPLPPAAVAVVAPMLLTAIMARLSLKNRRPRARVKR